MADIIFHYNKKHNDDQSIPPYIIKYKGETFYIHHIDSMIGFSTKETPENPSTKGSLKFKGNLNIVNEGGKLIAYIT